MLPMRAARLGRLHEINFFQNPIGNFYQPGESTFILGTFRVFFLYVLCIVYFEETIPYME